MAEKETPTEAPDPEEDPTAADSAEPEAAESESLEIEGTEADSADADDADSGDADSGDADPAGDAEGADAGDADADGADSGGADAGGADAESADPEDADAGGAGSGGADAGGAGSGGADAGGAEDADAETESPEREGTGADALDTEGADSGGADDGGADAQNVAGSSDGKPPRRPAKVAAIVVGAVLACAAVVAGAVWTIAAIVDDDDADAPLFGVAPSFDSRHDDDDRRKGRDYRGSGKDDDKFERGFEREERERRGDERRDRDFKDRDSKKWAKPDGWTDSDRPFPAEGCRKILSLGGGDESVTLFVCNLPGDESHEELELDEMFDEMFEDGTIPDLPLELLPFFGLMGEDWFEGEGDGGPFGPFGPFGERWPEGDEWPFGGDGEPFKDERPQFEDAPWPFDGDGGRFEDAPWPFGEGRPFRGERPQFEGAPWLFEGDGGQFGPFGERWFDGDGGRFGWIPVPLDRDGGSFGWIPVPLDRDGGSFGWIPVPEGDGGLFDEDMYDDERWLFGSGIEIPFGDGARGFWYGNDGTEGGFCFSQGDQLNCYSDSDLLPGDAAGQFEQLMEMLREVGLGDLFGFDFEFPESEAEPSDADA